MRASMVRSAVIVLATIGLIVVACTGTPGASSAPVTNTPSASPTSAARPAESPTEAPTQAALGAYAACANAATAPLTLKVWDQEGRDGIGPAIDQLDTEFQAANPGVTIVRKQLRPDGLQATAATALADPAGPDIVQIPADRTAMGAAVASRLLLPLTPYVGTYGWDDRWAPGVLARLSFSDDGRTIGAGSLFGVPVSGEIAGLFWNHDFAYVIDWPRDRSGLSDAPRTFAELMQDFAASKTQGFVPIAFGARDGGSALVYASILESSASRAWLEDFVFGRGAASFDTPETIAAAATLVDMIDQGFVIKGFDEMDGAEALRSFAARGSTWLWTSSSAVSDLTEMPSELHFDRVPPGTAGGPAVSPARLGLPWAVRRTTADPDCAAAYLDFVSSDHAMLLVAGLDGLPSHLVAGGEYSEALFRETAFEFGDANMADQVGYYLDMAFPDASETFDSWLGRLMAKDITPEQFARNVDSAYQAFLATLE